MKAMKQVGNVGKTAIALVSNNPDVIGNVIFQYGAAALILLVCIPLLPQLARLINEAITCFCEFLR